MLQEGKSKLKKEFHGFFVSEVMDADSACAIWEEVNCPVCAKIIILWRLSLFVGTWIKVPVQKFCELKFFSLLPTSDSVVLNNNKIHFWYKHTDEAILHNDDEA